MSIKSAELDVPLLGEFMQDEGWHFVTLQEPSGLVGRGREASETGGGGE